MKKKCVFVWFQIFFLPLLSTVFWNELPTCIWQQRQGRKRQGKEGDKTASCCEPSHLTHAHIFESAAHWSWLFWLHLRLVLGFHPGFWSTGRSPSPARLAGAVQGSSPASSALWKAHPLLDTQGELGLRWGGRAASSHWECQESGWHKMDMASQGWWSILCLKNSTVKECDIKGGGGEAKQNTFFPEQV